MIEKPVLLDPDESTFGAHMELIQDGTISVRSGVDFKRFPPNTVDKLVEDHTSNCSICGQLPYARRPPGGTTGGVVGGFPWKFSAGVGRANPGCPGGLVGKLMPISALPCVMLYTMSNVQDCSCSNF